MHQIAVSPLVVEQLRAFNRFYTQRLGMLERGVLQTDYSLTQARVLWEIANQPDLLASDLVARLQLNAGYLSRCIKRLRTEGLVDELHGKVDRRQHLLRLTPQGKRVFALLNTRSESQARSWLSELEADQQMRLGQALSQAQGLLTGTRPASYSIRPFRTGDLGWIVHKHGELYHQEYGWDHRFEALVARIAADFLERFMPGKEQAWIAELEGQRVGSVALVRARDETTGRVIRSVAQLRLLLVEPSARGLGLGKALAVQCEDFARAQGYTEIRLWTNQNLHAARAIYQARGYQRISTERHRSFGFQLVGEVWQLSLR
jgi:DNA-binding MarR family transcriptional regulator/GNAT superfamily N-acetyltransferase